MRIPVIDILRGAVMVLMVIDHARDYAAGPGQVSDPMDLATVSPFLYLLRWLTHFCAPVFAFLMGTSAALSRRTTAGRLAWRGLLLLLLEFTLVDWAWNFYPPFPRKYFQVIAALGMANLLLAALWRLGPKVILAVGLLLVFGHNLLDGLRFADGSWQHYGWSFLHQRNVLPLPGGWEVRTSYPFLPIAGVALAGYGCGAGLFASRRRLWQAGAGMLLLFLLLRLPNLYGDQSQFLWSTDWGLTLRSLGNVTKYPFSLQFVLMTLGLAFLAAAGAYSWRNAALESLGKTPMFFYVVHLYLLHAGALAAAWALGYGWGDFGARIGGLPVAFGFPLWLVLPITAVTTAVLLPACRWYGQRKLPLL